LLQGGGGKKSLEEKEKEKKDLPADWPFPYRRHGGSRRVKEKEDSNKGEKGKIRLIDSSSFLVFVGKFRLWTGGGE